MRYLLLCVLALTCCMALSGGEPDVLVDSQPLLDLLTELNWARTEAGLGPVGVNTQLQLAAQVRAAQQAVRGGEPSHREPEPWHQVVDRVGYRGGARGEVLAWGIQTPQEVVPAWIASPAHRSVVLYPGFVAVGVGLDWNGQTPYFVALFGSEP